MTVTRGEEFMLVDTTAESVPGVKNTSQTRKPFRVVGGGIGVKHAPEFVETEEHAGSVAQPAPFLAGMRPKGNLNVIPSPYDATTLYGTSSFFKFALDRTHARTSGRLASNTLYHVVPGIVTNEFCGCKLNGYTLGWQSGSPRLELGLDVMGLNGGKLSSTLTSSDLGTLPSNRDWIVSNIAIQLGSSTSVVTSARTLVGLQCQFTNNCEQRERGRWISSGRTNPENNGVLDIFEGGAQLTGSFDLRLDDDSWIGRLEAGSTFALRILAFHQNSSTYTPSSSFTTTSNPTVTIAEDFTTGQLAAGTYVLLEDYTAADPASWLHEVLRVKTETATGGAGVNTIQLETDGSTDANSVGRSQTFTTSTKIKTLGFQYLVTQGTVMDWEVSGSAKQQGVQRVPWRASMSGSTALATYMLK